MKPKCPISTSLVPRASSGPTSATFRTVCEKYVRVAEFREFPYGGQAMRASCSAAKVLY
jgi:hypothetical protein